MTKEITKTVPTLSEIYSDSEAIAKQSKLNIILNADPKQEWVKMHPFVKNLKYLPIERVEYLLTMIFSKWRVEVKEVKLVANSVVVCVRVHVLDPISSEWDYQDGIGAMPIQISKDAKSAIAFEHMNTSAIQIGAPAAESFAIKDACEKFGRIFGKDLNRKDNISYDRLYSMIEGAETFNNPAIPEALRKEVEACTTDKALKAVWEANKGLGKEFSKLITAQRDFIKSVQNDETA